MSDIEKREVTERLCIVARQLHGICRMVANDRPDAEVLAQLKATSQGLVAVRRTLLWLVTERMLRLANGLTGQQREECLRTIMNLQRKYGE